MKIQYCPVCMNELIGVGMLAFHCPYCKIAFHINIEYGVRDLQEATKDRDAS